MENELISTKSVMAEHIRTLCSKNFCDEKGRTVLMLTACNEPGFASPVEMIQSLIATGADVNAKDNNGATALMYAIFYDGNRGESEKVDIVRILIGAGADVNAKDNVGKTALMYSVMFGHSYIYEILCALIDAGADVNATDNAGNTTLMYTAKGESDTDGGYHQLGIAAQILLDKGVDVNAKNKRGKTALYLATENDKIDLCNVLGNFGANTADFKKAQFIQGLKNVIFISCSAWAIYGIITIISKNFHDAPSAALFFTIGFIIPILFISLPIQLLYTFIGPKHETFWIYAIQRVLSVVIPILYIILTVIIARYFIFRILQ